MSEADFWRWMKIQKWTAVPFQIDNNDSFPVNGGGVGLADSWVFPVRQIEQRTRFKVKRGYCYMWAEPDSPDTTVKVIYDRDSHRAYFEHSTY
jgi:hypothetical protein